jgi:hypothetical protein
VSCLHIELASAAATTAQILSFAIIDLILDWAVSGMLTRASVLADFGAPCPIVQVLQGLYHVVHNV